MSLDMRSLYPNFHAETSRHLSASPRPTSSKGTSRKPQKQTSSPTKRPSSKSRLHISPLHVGQRSGLSNNNQSGRAESPVKTSRRPMSKQPQHVMNGNEEGMPPLAVPIGVTGSRPATSSVGPSPLGRSASEQRLHTRELSFKAGQPTKLQQNLTFEDGAFEQSRASTAVQAPSRARSVVIRGELVNDLVTASSAGCEERVFARARTPSSSSLLRLQAHDSPLQDVVMCSARPRSRYARREIMTPIQPLRHGLTASASAPTLSKDSALIGSGLSGNSSGSTLRGSQSTSGICPSTPSCDEPPPHTKKPMISWTEQDTSSFFLTEIDAKEAADQWKIARALAQGSHFLYGRCEYEQAVASFADALTVVQEYAHATDGDLQVESSTMRGSTSTSTYTPLLSLLHHHMGVAFKESAQDKWALLMQKKALELAQRSGDLKLQGRALKALGVLFLDRKDPEKALECQQQALKIAMDTHDSELQARVYANLGNLAAAQQQLPHAVSCHERDLAFSSTPPMDSAVGQARAHRNLSLIFAKMEDKQDQQLDHELYAARIVAANAFETDMRRHAGDVVGNIYCQLSRPDPKLVDMVATSLTDVLTLLC